MPPRNYTLLHPDSRLSDEERAALIGELEALEGDDEDRSGSNRGRAEVSPAPSERVLADR